MNSFKEHNTKGKDKLYINTAAIGFYILNKDEAVNKEALEKIIAKLIQRAGSNIINMEYKNELLLIAITKAQGNYYKDLEAIRLWMRRYKSAYKGVCIGMGEDKRSIDSNISSQSSVYMSRYRMYKDLLQTIPDEQLSPESIKDYVDIVKQILNGIVPQGQLHMDEEAYEVSSYLDTLLNRYQHKKNP